MGRGISHSSPSEPAMFVKRLPNVFQTSMAFGTHWVAVVQMSLVHWVRAQDYNRCENSKVVFLT